MYNFIVVSSVIIILLGCLVPIWNLDPLFYVDEEFFVALSFIVFVDLIGQQIVSNLSDFLTSGIHKQKQILKIIFSQFNFNLLKNKIGINVLVIPSKFIEANEFFQTDLQFFLYQRVAEFGYREALEGYSLYNFVEKLGLNKLREKAFVNSVQTLADSSEDSFLVLRKISRASTLSFVAKLD